MNTGRMVMILAVGGLCWWSAPQMCRAGEAAASNTVFLSDQPGLIFSASQGCGELGLNTVAHLPGQAGAPLRIGGKAYAKGLGHHANGNITVLLEGGYTSFDAEVGVPPEGGTVGSIVFRVLVDGECRFDSGVMRASDAPKSVHVALKGADELRLELRDAGDNIYGDAAVWADARLTRDPAVSAKPPKPPTPPAYILEAPAVPRTIFDIPSIRAVADAGGERITLQNYALTLELRVDSAKRVTITSLKTEAGRELLAKPSPCFSLVNADGSAFKDGPGFKLDKWHMWLHDSHAEVELRLLAPEPVVWRLRLYREKSYLEQTFEIPGDWRTGGRALAATLFTADTLRPVMPVNTLRHGFKKGASQSPGRNRFEVVDKCEHLIYDPEQRAGLAAFVVGVGGEERMYRRKTELLDHATPALGANDPLAKMVIFPFDGAVEKGFQKLRRFIAEDYACQSDKNGLFVWNQFWLWQGKHPDWGYQECTAARLLDILPHLKAIGVESFHIDAGWEKGLQGTPRPNPEDWDFDPVRFPQGFEPIRKFLRENSMNYVTHLFTGAINSPGVMLRIIEQTDLDKLFLDAGANEQTLAAMRSVRAKYPDIEVFCHSMSDVRRASSYWGWGNLHYLSDFNQVYFGEGSWAPYMQDLPPEMTKARFVDLYTRTASYQATWVWPLKCILPPHGGFALAGMAWYIPEMNMTEAASYVLTTIASRYMYEWGEDPRLIKPEILNFFMDWTAFWKTARPYLQDFQHILPPPDGVHPDGIAHFKGDNGFMILFNPGNKPATVALKELLWSPELELDPRKPAELTDWTQPLDPTKLRSVNLSNPKGEVTIGAQSFKVLGVNLDFEVVKGEVKRQRSLLHWPPKPAGSKL